MRGNPWADVGQQFPTPPRRNQSTRTAGTSSSSTASGADRWNTRFSTGVPPTARQKAPTSSETRKNAAQAFANMRPGKAGASTKADTGPSRPSAAQGPPPPTPPRTESAKQRQQASFGARKTGYQPRSGLGDEPPVSNSNYTRRTDPPPEPPRQTTGASSANYRMPDPLSQFRDKTSTDTRQSSPYTTSTGEKVNPFDGAAPKQDLPKGAPPPFPERPKAPCRPARTKTTESTSDAEANATADGQHPSMYANFYNLYIPQGDHDSWGFAQGNRVEFA